VGIVSIRKAQLRQAEKSPLIPGWEHKNQKNPEKSGLFWSILAEGTVCTEPLSPSTSRLQGIFQGIY
jgi:hypothetical protein